MLFINKYFERTIYKEQKSIWEYSIQSEQPINMKCKCCIKSHFKIENKEKYTNKQNTWIDTDKEAWQKE